jgi:hypothetical protein
MEYSGQTPPDGIGNRERIALIGLSALALGLGVSTAVLATSGPREVTTTQTSVATETLKPTTTTVVTEVLTTTTNTRTTTETTETVTETVTEAIPPGQEDKRGSGGKGADGEYPRRDDS